MRLGTVTLSASLSAALLSGCSFIGGQSSPFKNPFASQKAATSGRYVQQNQRCQIASPRQPIPHGCRPEQVTIGTYGQAQSGGAYPGGAYGGAQGGFPQQPQFGQPQYTSGGYGNAVGQTAVLVDPIRGERKRKPKLRGSLSLGLEKSIDGDLLEFDVRDDLSPAGSYNPQDFLRGGTSGSQAAGQITTTSYTANDLDAANIFAPNAFESASTSNISFEDAWSTPVGIKAGLEYIINDKTTIFANGGYSYADGEETPVSTITATLYEQVATQNFAPVLDAAGNAVPGAFAPNGAPIVNTTFIPNQEIASFSYNFSDLERYDLEVGARRYFSPLNKSDGFRSVTPFVGASVGLSRLNAVDFTTSQTQVSYDLAFAAGSTDGTSFDVPSDGTSTRLYDSEWLVQGQLNVGAEWQVTPGFAIAAETGLRFQDSRDYADFTNAAGNFVEGPSGDVDISIPLTLRGSVNF